MVHTVPLTKLSAIKLCTKNGEVITLKHKTILKINLSENVTSENNILCVICCIAKLQGHKGVIKTQICSTAGCPIPCSPHSYLFLVSDACMLLGNALMFCISWLFYSPFDTLIV